jgi:hypothetical protein
VIRVALSIAVKNPALVIRHARLDWLNEGHIKHVADMFARAEEIEFQLFGSEPLPLSPKAVEMKIDL